MTIRISQTMLAILGAVSAACGVEGLLILRLLAPEKSAYYVFNHWFDAVKLHVGMCVVGATLLAIVVGRGLRQRS